MWFDADEQQGRLSPDEMEHVGIPCFRQDVEITEANGHTETVSVVASDNVDAITKTFELLYATWDNNRPKSGLLINVISL